MTALLAQLLVPNREPTNDPVNEPVLIWVEPETVPLGRNAVTCVDEDTVLVGSNSLTCAELDTVPEGSPDASKYDALIALVAQLPVPVNTPVNDPLYVPTAPDTTFVIARIVISDEDGGAEVKTTLLPETVKSAVGL